MLATGYEKRSTFRASLQPIATRRVVNNFTLDSKTFVCYIIPMKARKNKEGYMGSASRVHRVKKGKGSYSRKPKHRKSL